MHFQWAFKTLLLIRQLCTKRNIDKPNDVGWTWPVIHIAIKKRRKKKKKKKKETVDCKRSEKKVQITQEIKQDALKSVLFNLLCVLR